MMFEKVATPATAVVVRVPERTPAPLARLTVNTSVTVTSTTPFFRARTTGCVTRGCPLVEPPGCTEISRPMVLGMSSEMSYCDPLASQVTGPPRLTTADSPLISKAMASPGSAPSSTPGVSTSSRYTAMAAKYPAASPPSPTVTVPHSTPSSSYASMMAPTGTAAPLTVLVPALSYTKMDSLVRVTNVETTAGASIDG